MTQPHHRSSNPAKPPDLPRNFFYPLAVYMSADGGEWVVRDYAGQSGRFCVIGPWTVDVVGSFKTLSEACAFIEKRAGRGKWEYKTT